MLDEFVNLLRAGVDYLAPADEPGADHFEVASIVALLENLNEEVRTLRGQAAAQDGGAAGERAAALDKSRATNEAMVAKLAELQEELSLREKSIRRLQLADSAHKEVVANLEERLADSQAALTEALTATVVSGIETATPGFDSGEQIAAGNVGFEARLLVRYPKGEEVSMRVPGSISIGRSLLNDICFAGSAVSRRHATIKWDGALATLVDCGSTNGVWVNDLKVSEHQLRDGDVITIGPLSCIFMQSAK
jgi:hypothetical protein